MPDQTNYNEGGQLCQLPPGVSLQPVWNVLLDIYGEFDAFCQRRGLVHYVAYGTLLGAVRHKGFIPWDDDFDVMMPRPDYENLMSLRDELPEHLHWQSLETDEKYSLLFGKIYETKRGIIEQVQKESGLSLPQGLYIDVFPLDGFPKSAIAAQIWHAERALRRRMCSSRSLQNWFKKREYGNSFYVGLANCEYSEPYRYRYPKDALGKPRRTEFAGILVNTPSDPERLLELDYGDWRKLPPFEKRVPTHQLLHHHSVPNFTT